jgi:hypothetical protein
LDRYLCVGPKTIAYYRKQFGITVAAEVVF